MEFENLRDALSDPQDKLEIIKTVVEDGAPLTVAMASFSCHWIGPAHCSKVASPHRFLLGRWSLVARVS